MTDQNAREPEAQQSQAASEPLPDNVVSLFGRTPKPPKANLMGWAEVERKNQETADRLRKERLAANKSVLRSYRIKN